MNLLHRSEVEGPVCSKGDAVRSTKRIPARAFGRGKLVIGEVSTPSRTPAPGHSRRRLSCIEIVEEDAVLYTYDPVSPNARYANRRGPDPFSVAH